MLPASLLFLVAPLIAEFLLGNLPITMLPGLVVLAPMYGGGALVIREVVRRMRRGWLAIFFLAMAYAIVEEAFTTQTLFNPNYLHLNLGLLEHGFIPFLGIGAWWTLYVLSLHAIWSISVSIAIVEGMFPSTISEPWLGTKATLVACMVFLFGIVATTQINLKLEAERGGIFVATAGQFTVPLTTPQNHRNAQDRTRQLACEVS